MRYKKYIDHNYVNSRPSTSDEWLKVYKNDITEDEKIRNECQAQTIYALYHMIIELFEITDVVVCVGNETINFERIIKDYGNDNHLMKVGAELSRDLLLKATPAELSGIIIDMILDRNNWTKERLSLRVHFD